MNIPNALTMSRFVFAFLIMVLLMLPFPFMASLSLFLFILAGISDFFDGYLARTVYGTSSFGKLMDPLADKVMVSAVLISFVEIRLDLGQGVNRPLVHALPVVIIIAREFLVTGLRLLAAGKREVLSAGKWGKHKTVWQIVAIVVILFGLAFRNDIYPFTNPTKHAMADYDFGFYYVSMALMIAVSVITVVSGAKYFVEHKELIFRSNKK